MGIRSYHVERNAVKSQHIAPNEIDKTDVAPTFLQSGRTSVSFPFAATGEENVSATISFPKAFAVAPAVACTIGGIDVGIVRLVVGTGTFTIYVRDDKGTDYTTSQTATVNWIAAAV